MIARANALKAWNRPPRRGGYDDQDAVTWHRVMLVLDVWDRLDEQRREAERQEQEARRGSGGRGSSGDVFFDDSPPPQFEVKK